MPNQFLTKYEFDADRKNYYIQKVSQYLKDHHKKAVAFVRSFGCQQNESDTEKLSGMLEAMGFTFTQDPKEASLILFNTCAVRENAELRVFGILGSLKKIKEENRAIFVLCGCMVQQESVREKLQSSYSYVDLIIGPSALSSFPELLSEKMENESARIISVSENISRFDEDLKPRRNSDHSAWVTVMYGCNNFCSYCIVPYVRGREVSREPDDILNEVRTLIREGYKEITLLGQNVNSYGKTLSSPISFAELLRRICTLDGDFRIRFMTSHPKDCTRDLLEMMASQPKICKQLHLPVQSGSNEILDRMNRKYTVESYLQLIDHAKALMPDIAIPSDIIVGFPGESYEDFQKTLSLVRTVGYERLFTFIYSKRSGTKAAQMDDPVGAKTKGDWLNELLLEQEKITSKKHDEMVGKCYNILVESKSKEIGHYTGKTEGYVVVDFPSDKDLTGKFATVRITGAEKAFVHGQLVE